MADIVVEFWGTTGFLNMTGGQLLMIVVSCILFYLAVAKGFEPLLLIPIAFGMLLTNLPLSGVLEPSGSDGTPGGLIHSVLFWKVDR